MLPGASGNALWWWRFHQITIAVLVAASPVLAFVVRKGLPVPYGRWGFLLVLGLATLGVTLRLNLVFLSRVHPDIVPAHRRRLFPWIAASEGLLAILLLTEAVLLGSAADATAAPLLSLALVPAGIARHHRTGDDSRRRTRKQARRLTPRMAPGLLW